MARRKSIDQVNLKRGSGAMTAGGVVAAAAATGVVAAAAAFAAFAEVWQIG